MNEKALYENQYEHCGRIWVDEWDCMCNDRCPICNMEIEPFYSEDLTEDDTEQTEQATATILQFPAKRK